MQKAMDINNTCSIYQIAEDTLGDARIKQGDFINFIAITRWKPNISDTYFIKIFMKRMKEKNLKIPNPNEHFSYVIVNDDPTIEKIEEN